MFKDNMGLVLEGGGMRGTFTSGVLDCFMDYGIEFPYIIGVSAGGSNGLSFASRQRGRAHACNIDFLRKYNYIGLRFMFTQGCIMDYKYLFGKLPLVDTPYNFSAYKEFFKKYKYILVATNCLTGEPEYFTEANDEAELLVQCRASCSMPFISTVVIHKSVPYLDGGVADAIPLKKANKDGFSKNIVILTRNYGYRKNDKFPKWLLFRYRKYPNFQKALERKTALYNEAVSEVEKQEKQGNVLVIRPLEPLKIGRLEKNPDRLEALYQHGYQCAKKKIQQILSF